MLCVDSDRQWIILNTYFSRWVYHHWDFSQHSLSSIAVFWYLYYFHRGYSDVSFNSVWPSGFAIFITSLPELLSHHLGIGDFNPLIALPASRCYSPGWALASSTTSLPLVLGFWTKLFFTGWGCWPHAQHPSWRTRISLLVWILPFDLLVVKLPPALLSRSQSHKPHHDKVESPLGGDCHALP
jgi:hypothetical protein